jgi:hypothetical protein
MFGMDVFVFAPTLLIRSPATETKPRKGEHMNPSSEPNELQEVHLQEADLKTINDTSLPAGQVIAEQSEDAEEHLTPRFIP